MQNPLSLLCPICSRPTPNFPPFPTGWMRLHPSTFPFLCLLLGCAGAESKPPSAGSGCSPARSLGKGWNLHFSSEEGDLLPSAPGQRKSSPAGGGRHGSACGTRLDSALDEHRVHRFIIRQRDFSHRMDLDHVQMDLGMANNGHRHAERLFFFCFHSLGSKIAGFLTWHP